jgi:hypothetical protein
MHMKPFEPTRPNGKSDRRLVVELVRDADPGTLFDFKTLTSALQWGTTREINRRVITAAVTAANRTLLVEQKRILHSIAGVGYRLAHANDHTRLADGRKARAHAQLQWAVDTLAHVRWDEMDPNVRAAHEAQLMIVAAHHQALSALKRTQDRHEQILRQLVGARAAA